MLANWVGNKKDWYSSYWLRRFQTMKGSEYHWVFACICAISIGQINAQEGPDASPVDGVPLKDSNETKVAADQNKTAPNTPPAVPTPTDSQPASPPASAADGVPKSAGKPKITEPMPEPLGGVDFGDFIRRNPFNLERPSDNPPPKKVFTPAPPAKPTVRLSGMTAFRGNKKVLLEIRVPGQGATPLYHALAEAESANGVKVLSIDPEKGEVKLDIRGEEATRSFDEEKGKGEIESMAGGRGSSRGSSSRGSSSRGSSSSRYNNRRPTTPTRPSNGSGGGLKSIPTRGRQSSLSPYKEPSVFDKVVQTEMIVATQINTHREFPRGVVAIDPPTDLPLNRR